MDAARAALDAAGARQKKIDDLIAEQQARLNAIDKTRQNRGRGRPPAHEASTYAAIERKIDRLKRGELPDDAGAGAGAAPSADVDLRASARQHPQHHAAAGVAPQGRSSNSAGGGSSSGAGSGGSGGGGGGAVDDDGPDDDDDEESVEFKQYYRVPQHQKAWNEKVAHEYSKGLRERGAIEVEPPNLLRSCCDPALVGLGKVHICAPHLHLGLPLPPCPRHGWDAVDRGKLHSKGFSCGARRVYADPADEGLVGTRIVCDLCKEEKREKQSVLDDLEEEEADAEEIDKARAEAKAATYSYRSYNPISLRLYAQRYYWYVASLEYVVLNRRTAVTRKLARRIMRALPNKTSASDLAEEVRATSIEPRATPLLIVHWAAARTDIGSGGPTYSHFCCTWLLLPSLHPHLLFLPAHGEQGRGV